MSERIRSILLVDDDADFLEITGGLLEAQGYRVLPCSSPQAAWERLAQERPDLVVSDLMMTNLDSGFSLARRIKDDPRLAGLPVLIVTAVSSALGFDLRPRSPAELAASGADAWLEKPVVPQKLLSTVRELLARAPGGGSP